MIKDIILIVTAIIPVIILLKFIFDKDRIEKEPIILLMRLFILGTLSVIIVLFLSKLLPDLKNNFYHSFIRVAFVEEFAKFAIIYLVSWKSKEFNYIFDAIVYSIFVSLGFACFENIMYTFTYGITTSLFRGILSVPCHAFYAVYMGYFLGKSKVNNNVLFKSLSLLIPIILHGIYDYLLLSENLLLYIIFIIYIIILYNTSLKIIDKVSKDDFQLDK